MRNLTMHRTAPQPKAVAHPRARRLEICVLNEPHLIHNDIPQRPQSNHTKIKNGMADPEVINMLPLYKVTGRQNSIKTSIASLTPPIPPGREYTQEEADGIPWKYIGYRVFSRWLATNQSFLIVRKFSAANTRIILMLQDQVADLEEQLNEIDDYCARRGTGDFDNGTFRNDSREDRKNVLEKLRIKLNEYSKYVWIVTKQSDD
jgi:hypothetical protein